MLIKADRVFVSPYCCFIYKSYILVQCISTCEKLPMNRESSIKKTYSISNREIVAVNVKFLNSCSVLIKADRVFVSPY